MREAVTDSLRRLRTDRIDLYQMHRPDPDVPFDISLRIAERLCSADVQTILVKDGDHRLSRPQDIALLTATLSQLLEAL